MSYHGDLLGLRFYLQLEPYVIVDEAELDRGVRCRPRMKLRWYQSGL